MKNIELTMKQNKNDKLSVEIYQPKKGLPSVEVHFSEETVWLSQKLMAQLFQKDTDTIGLHIRNTYREGELKEKPTTEKYSVVQKEDRRQVKRKIKYYIAKTEGSGCRTQP